MSPEVDLLAEVIRRVPLPIDGLEITALLESLGITDELARGRYGAVDAFDLADKVLARARMWIPVAVSEPAIETEPASRVAESRRAQARTRAWALAAGTFFALAAIGLALQIVGAPIGPDLDAPAADSPALVALPPAPSTAQPPRMILDERFDEYSRGWPDDTNSTAFLARDGYRLSARVPGRFVAVGAKLGQPARDVIVTATFRKLGGPPGGGYGVIVRDQGPGPRDGLSQSGRYYVLAASDAGNVGIWLREHDRWVDLVPWRRSSLVRPDRERNEVQAQTLGARLTLLLNGTAVADVTDATLPSGDVGVFVGGDGSEVLLEHLVAVLPSE
jgi:hypothetical protein